MTNGYIVGYLATCKLSTAQFSLSGGFLRNNDERLVAVAILNLIFYLF